MKDNLVIWNELKAVPREAKKKIGAGRLKGMTDIKPQWRLKMMTEQFGVIGIGWYYDTVKTWTESYGTEISAHVLIHLFVRINDEWSKPISGIGGSMLIANEKIKDYESSLYDTKFKPYHSDEAYKMATTDALSVAMKQLGVAADVYMGLSDSKYDKPVEQEHIKLMSPDQIKTLERYAKDYQNIDDKKHSFIVDFISDPGNTSEEADKIINRIKDSKNERN